MKKLLATATLTLTTAGLVGLSVPAAQADDVERRSGTCSQGAAYTMTLRDAGDDPDRTRVTFFISSSKADRVWTTKVKRGQQGLGRSVKRTKGNGNVTFTRVVRADDDARITVFAKAGYGETCRRVLSLDQDDRDD